MTNKNRVGPAIDLLELVLREASRDRRQEKIVEGQIELRDCRSTKGIFRLKICRSLLSPASPETGLNTKPKSNSLSAITIITSSCAHTGILQSCKTKERNIAQPSPVLHDHSIPGILNINFQQSRLKIAIR